MIEFDYLLTLAQDGAAEEVLPPAPGDDTEVTGQDGSANGPGGAAPPSGNPFGNQFFMLLLLLFGAMIIFSFLGQRRDRKKRDAMISAVKKHDRVQTVGGVIGSVVDVKTDTVVLKVDESSNTRMTFARSSIQQVLTPSAATKESSDQGGE